MEVEEEIYQPFYTLLTIYHLKKLLKSNRKTIDNN